MIYLIIEMYTYTLKMFMEAYTSVQILLSAPKVTVEMIIFKRLILKT